MCVGVCAGAGADGTRCEDMTEFLYPQSGRPGTSSSALGAAGPAL